MMTIVGLFGDDRKDERDQEALAAERERIEAMPLPELAEEVLIRAWGRGGPGDAYAKEQGETGVAMHELQALFGLSATTSLFGSPGGPTAIVEVIEEALQLLEHAGLVLLRVGGGDIVKAEFRPTRAGLRAIDAGDVRARLETRPA